MRVRVNVSEKEEDGMYVKPPYGWIIVYTGGMFSGKTLELVLWGLHTRRAGYKVQAFKHTLDGERYTGDHLDSHDGLQFPCIAVADSATFSQLIEVDTEVVILDEANFFDEGLPVVINSLARRDVLVVVGGLDRDFRDDPFGPMPDILAYADEVYKMHAVCARKDCRIPAGTTSRRGASADDDTVVVGGAEAYEPLCRRHYVRPLVKEERDG